MVTVVLQFGELTLEPGEELLHDGIQPAVVAQLEILDAVGAFGPLLAAVTGDHQD